MIKNMVFDMGNVLLAYTPDDYMKTITQDEEAAAAVLKELFRSAEWEQLDAGSITEEDAVAQVCARIPQYSDVVQRAMDNWHSDLTPMTGMPEIVARLKEKGYRIYLLSNTSLRFYQYQDKVDMFRSFDGFIVSAKEKLVKPDVAIFDCLCERYGLQSGECLFVDDLQQNIDGAQKAGFHAHLFRGAKELSRYLEENHVL
ncbi:HAD family hydrolase [Caproiciproducens faecalis]|uniref:HAD family phosphatase n=1 Tax=Caproiciproducens faecalis TaxID=2820301 RepID=A0ABS7DK09_9FIRM|nr:HAD family phosphatase [Caproiciproducens faecalis]MBW7571439.1 HAD family phosphatase [Caproiciproducens faecalis]